MEKILIVDDAVYMRSMLRLILEKAGFAVIGEAKDGAEAVNQYIRLQPDLVLMDINMPVIDGLQATIMIKRLDAEAKIVVCSSMNRMETSIQAIQAGAQDILVKPFLEKHVVDTVQQVFKQTFVSLT